MLSVNWLKYNWTLVVFVVAVIASFVISDQRAHQRTVEQANVLIEACYGHTQRAALNVDGWMALSDRVRERDAPGDAVSSRRYGSIAEGILATVPLPDGFDPKDRLAVVEANIVNGAATLSPTALALQRDACEDRYRN